VVVLSAAAGVLVILRVRMLFRALMFVCWVGCVLRSYRLLWRANATLLVCDCACVCVWSCVCVCVWVSVYVSVYMCVCESVSVCVYECVYECVSECVCEWVWFWKCVYEFVCVNVCARWVCEWVWVWSRDNSRRFITNTIIEITLTMESAFWNRLEKCLKHFTLFSLSACSVPLVQVF
jgi:hypothetical protein